ncbi:unnamed protein product [Parnassius mnemosyne]|uniref:Ig-like domain-containing protein n=1 Tax=Parnassius mnemosyne TaxID=213953 RepID=A0AAV1LG48_9NEOP
MRSLGKATLCLFVFAGVIIRSEATRPPALVTSLDVGENWEISVLTLGDNVEGCYLDTPRGETIEFKPVDNSNDKYKLEEDTDFVKCKVTVKNINSNDAGIWTLRSVSDSGYTRSESYEVTVNTGETSTEIPSTLNSEINEESSKEASTTDDAETTGLPNETTETTIETSTVQIEDVTIINMDPGYFVTKIGESHNLKIPEYDFLNSEKCYIVTPDGKQYDVEISQIYGIEVIKDYNVACGVKVHVVSEQMIGDWTLISRGIRYSTEVVERRLPFTIILEETVNALPSEITVKQGNNIYIRLEDSTPFHDTCKLIDPFNNIRTNIEKDSRYVDTCGFIVKNASEKDSGFWHIKYGERTIYKAFVRVTVNGDDKTDIQSHYTWTLDRPVEELMGPENTVYCRVVDANGNTVFDGFGRCNVTLNRVTVEHAGTWRMFVGLEGRVLTDEHVFEVSVREAAPKPVVSTSVVTDKPLVTLTCSVSSPHAVRSCKFRDPSGRILLANPGVGEDRYTFHGNGASLQSGVQNHECGIQITNPVIRDLGLWRCAMATDAETYYGFLTVLCPWAMQDPEVAATVESEPTLQAENEMVNGLVGETVTMSCSVQSAIRYCYFRASNGTTFSVSPGESTGAIEYAGAGFDAGDCSIRFSSLSVSDSGSWSCRVGFVNPSEAEQHASFEVSIQDTLVVEQKVEDNTLIITGRVHNDRAVEYCRFVRIDGLGFTTENLPEGYRSHSRLSEGRCEIWIPSPSVLELHPWSVAVRIRGQGIELSRQTLHSLQEPQPENENEKTIYRFPITWLMILIIGMSLIMTGILVGPKKNRTWTYARASSIRDSFRRSFSKKIIVEQSVPERNTPMSA